MTKEEMQNSLGLDDKQIGCYYYEVSESTDEPNTERQEFEFDTEIAFFVPLRWPDDAKLWERILAFFYPKYKRGFLITSKSPIIKFEIPKP